MLLINIDAFCRKKIACLDKWVYILKWGGGVYTVIQFEVVSFEITHLAKITWRKKPPKADLLCDEQVFRM